MVIWKEEVGIDGSDEEKMKGGRRSGLGVRMRGGWVGKERGEGKMIYLILFGLVHDIVGHYG